MEHAPWLGLWRTAYRQNRRSRFVQVATVSPEGLPEVRTVVLRGLSDAGEPYFITDARSAKCRSLEAQGSLELCVWWEKTQEQFRLRGQALMAGADAHPWGTRRRKAWGLLKKETRRLFLGPPPGTPLSEAPTRLEAPSGPPAHFLLVVLKPNRVDYLRLAEPQERQMYARVGNIWQGAQVTP